MLKMMNSVERISQLIPKFKQQLIFLEEREKLFRKINDYPVEHDSSLSNATTISQTLSIVSTNSPSPSSSLVPTNNLLSKISTIDIDLTSDGSGAGADGTIPFPDVYQIPLLPNALVKDIQDGILDKFGPHCSNRQVLIDAVAHDLIENYNLFYPTKKQFNDIGCAIVKYLKLPSTNENIAIWKDALQTKLKRKRSEYSNNPVVQEFRVKYSRGGSGRPVKRKLDETAERDRHKQMIVLPYNNEVSNDIQSKVEQLRDFSQIDVDTRLSLWKETFYFRRQCIRDRSTGDILNDFPGYGDSLLVFEEVKLLMQVDLSAEVRRQVPILLKKMLETPIFVTDSPPIRLIKVLCRQFDETIQHIFCDKEPSTPYPTLVCIDDLIYIYVDFHSILSTNSPDDAVALLIAMYTIFELSFDKKSRTIRLLYSILYGDKQFLSNSIRLLIKEKKIDIHREQLQLPSTSSNCLSNSSTTVIVESQAHSQIENNSLDDSEAEHDSSTINQTTTKPTSSNNNSQSSSKISVDTNECIENMDNTSSSTSSLQHHAKQTQKQTRKRKQNLNDQNDIFENSASQNDYESSVANRLPLNDATNSTSTSRQRKRTRRF